MRRLAAHEMLVVTPAIANLIRENKIFRIPSSIQTGAKHGMILLDDSLFIHWKERRISKEHAMEKCNKPDELEARIARAEAAMLSGISKKKRTSGTSRDEWRMKSGE